MTTETKQQLSKSRNLRRGGSRKARLAVLERLMTQVIYERSDDAEICHEEWLSHFRALGSSGFFKHEPDFSQALAECEQAIAAAKSDPNSRYLPPVDFMPHAPELHRRRQWRHGKFFYAIDSACLWIGSMYLRVIHQKPPLSQTEWTMLTEWFQKHLPRLEKRERAKRLPAELTQTVASLKYDLKEKNGRDPASTNLAQDLRLLYAHYHQRFTRLLVSQDSRGSVTCSANALIEA